MKTEEYDFYDYRAIGAVNEFPKDCPSIPDKEVMVWGSNCMGPGLLCNYDPITSGFRYYTGDLWITGQQLLWAYHLDGEEIMRRLEHPKH